MHAAILAAFFEMPRTVAATCSSAIVVFLIGIFAAKNDIAEARGLGKVAALGNLCFAMPLAIFGAEHLSDPRDLLGGVPLYMPWRMFWVYFVGCALVAAAVSIATKIGQRWSGLLFGLMMFSFIAMIHFPGALAGGRNRLLWTIVFRESSFGGGGLVLAASAIGGWRGPIKRALIIVGRTLIAIAMIVFGVEYFLHPTLLPGVPLIKELAAWIPGRAIIDYVTGAGLLVAGVCILLASKTRTAAISVGSWLLLLVLVIYGPVLIASLLVPNAAVQIEGINYFFDTLLFTGAILSLANAKTQFD